MNYVFAELHTTCGLSNGSLTNDHRTKRMLQNNQTKQKKIRIRTPKKKSSNLYVVSTNLLSYGFECVISIRKRSKLDCTIM